jgi:hypothetical protein
MDKACYCVIHAFLAHSVTQVGLDLTKCRETPLRSTGCDWDGKIQFEQLCDFTEKRSNCSGVGLNKNLSDSVNIRNFEEIAAQVGKTLELLL